MASQPCAAPLAAVSAYRRSTFSHSSTNETPPESARFGGGGGGRSKGLRMRVSYAVDGDDSYLGMWKKAVDRERKRMEFQRIAEKTASARADGGGDVEEEEEEEEEKKEESVEAIERKTDEFNKILEVPKEERDRIQGMQVINRAAAAIAAARAVLNEQKPSPESDSGDSGSSRVEASKDESGGEEKAAPETGKQNENLFGSSSGGSKNGAPGPDFWSWTPPPDDAKDDDVGKPKAIGKNSSDPIISSPVMEKDQSLSYLSIPFESKLSEDNRASPIPPLQSLVDAENAKNVEVPGSTIEAHSLDEEQKVGALFSEHATEAAHALKNADEASSYGVNPDGSRWWKETGIDQRPDGVLCRWTLTRGVSADRLIEWEDKYWEAADEFGYKELGSEKSGRDAAGNVWHEFWRESMRQESEFVHFEKTADKWGKNGKGDEWQEKWWEHYDSSGKAEKWADKWCSIDPSTHVEAGHAHVWHERWGETYDGQGGSTKYTDKWAERAEGDGWTKWGDKWDENFDLNGHGVKQGETWWKGKHGEQWNRTWGERHNGSGWVHKYGKSSSGEHWDTHVKQDTWYERFPHYGFWRCFENSLRLREVKKPSET